MFKYLFFIIFTPLLGCTQKDIQIDKLLQERFASKDSALVYLAIVRSDKLNKIIPNNTLVKHYSKTEHSFDIENSALFKEFNRYFVSLKNKENVLGVIDMWLHNDSLQKKIEIETNVPFEQVLYENESTRGLVKKYTEQQGQSWESLTSWQSYELYIDFMNLCESLPDKKRSQLFSSLMRTAKKAVRV